MCSYVPIDVKYARLLKETKDEDVNPCCRALALDKETQFYLNDLMHFEGIDRSATVENLRAVEGVYIATAAAFRLPKLRVWLGRPSKTGRIEIND